MDERYFKYKSRRMIANSKLLDRFLQHVGEDFRAGAENVMEVDLYAAEMKCNIVPEIAKLSDKGYNTAFRGNYLVRWCVSEDKFGFDVRVFDINKFIETLPSKGILAAITAACSMTSSEKLWEDITDIEELSEAIIYQVDKFVNDVTKVIELADKEVKKMTENIVIKFESKND